MTREHRSWKPIVARAESVAYDYRTRFGFTPTLRQLHYVLVSERVGGYRNTKGDYSYLSERTAEARREGTFPDLEDGTRRITRPATFSDPADAIRWLANLYRLDRTEGQNAQVWVVVEKATLSALASRAVEQFGVPVVALRGFPSQTLVDNISREMAEDGRPAQIIYIGDLDPSGEDIERDLRERLTFTDFDLTRLAVTEDQKDRFGLVQDYGKVSDSRAQKFRERHGGHLFQIEVEALDAGYLSNLLRIEVESMTFMEEVRWIESMEESDADHLRAQADAVGKRIKDVGSEEEE